MPQPAKLVKAELQEISWGKDQKVQDGDANQTVKVQFNPESLTVSFANQASGGDQSGGAAIQFVGKGTTNLKLDLWFDATVSQPDPNVTPDGDVRKLTERVAHFMKPKPVPGQKDKFIPPGVRFLWGTFLFEGVMESLTEKLEFFGEDGKPLRASLSIGLKSQDIQFQFGAAAAAQQPSNEAAGATAGKAAGTQPGQTVKSGDTVQQMAAKSGQKDWQSVAERNGIENPRLPQAGITLNINV